jgi:hypothetical protein
MRLDWPKAWPQAQARLDKAGVPTARRGYRPRHQLAWEILAKTGAALPQGGRTGEEEMGCPYGLRRRLAALGERYMLAVPANTLRRDLETPPEYSGRGRRAKRPWHSVEQWRQSLDDEAWRRIDVRAGAQGPLVVDVVKRRVASRTPRRQQGDEELLVVMRYHDRDHQQVVQGDEYLSPAAPETPLGECARVAKAAHRIAACRQRSKSAAGLADYEGRNWTGWHPHQTLSFLAPWFLERETYRGEKMAARDPVTADSPRPRADLARGVSVRDEVAYGGRTPEALATP